MQKKIIARTAKLLSESKRSRRHQGIATSYEHIPADIDERGHGSIYALVNVNAASESAEEIAELIIDAFHGEYYQDLTKDASASFEAALARVNEELAEATHNGNIHWMGNLHAILAVHNDEGIYVAQTGKVEAHLYRGGKDSLIPKDGNGDSINPLRTFQNFVIFDLLEGDKVVFVTPGVFYHISKDELQRYVEEFQPKVAISHIADLLEGNSTDLQPNSLLIIEGITPEAASEETLTEIQDEVWLAEPNKPVETAIEASAPFVQKAIFYTRKGLAAFGGFVTATMWPWIHDHTLDTYDFIVDVARGTRSGKLKKEKKEASVIFEQPKEVVEVEAAKETIDDLKINDHTNTYVEDAPKNNNIIRIKEADNKPKWLKLEKIDFSKAGKIKDNLSSKLKKTNQNKRSMLIVAVAVFLVLVVSVFSVWRIRENAEDQRLAEASYTEAQSKLTIGKGQADSGDRSGAATTLNNALDIARSLEKNANYKDKAIALEKELTSVLDTVLSITRANPTKMADVKSIVGENVFGPYLVNDSLYMVSKSNGNIAAVSINGGESSNVLDSPSIDGKITAATAVPVRSTLVIYTDKGNVYEFDTKDLTLTKQAIAGDMENAIAMASFSTNIYTLTSDGKIYKRTKTSTGYSARGEYINDGSNVAGAISLAIDSNVYAMKANGEVIQYLGGKKQEYSLSNLPITIKAATHVFTNEDTTGLYISEASEKRIVRIDAEGKYVGEYLSDTFSGASAVYADDTAKVIYTFASGTLYSFAE